jgi:Domain of unknown function (DUF4157)
MPRPASPSTSSGAPEQAAPSSGFRMPAGVADYYQVAQAGVSGASDPLPHGDAIQRSFGHHDLGDVRATVGGGAPSALGAEAYTMGRSVAFSGPPSLHVAAHEAAHAVQQQAGVHLYGGGGDALEQHADAVADKVVRGESAESLLDDHQGGGSRNAVQCKMKFNGGTGYLDADQAQHPLPPLYAWVQGNAKAMQTMVNVHEGTPTSGMRAEYKFKQQSAEGEIIVQQRKYAGQNDKVEEEERNGIFISMTHETQHAVDDLSQQSPLQNEVAGHGQAKSDDFGRMEDILSELHAHAVQAALAIQLKSQNKGVPYNDDLLSQGFKPSLENALHGNYDSKDLFQKKLMTYLVRYHSCMDFGDVKSFVTAHEKDVEKIIDWYDKLVQVTSKKDLVGMPVNGLAQPPPQQSQPVQKQGGGMSPMAWTIFMSIAMLLIAYFALFRS